MGQGRTLAKQAVLLTMMWTSDLAKLLNFRHGVLFGLCNHFRKLLNLLGCSRSAGDRSAGGYQKEEWDDVEKG